MSKSQTWNEIRRRQEEKTALYEQRKLYDFNDLTEARKVKVDKTTHKLGKFKITTRSVANDDEELVMKKDKRVQMFNTRFVEEKKEEVVEPVVEDVAKEEVVVVDPTKVFKKPTKKSWGRK